MKKIILTAFLILVVVSAYSASGLLLSTAHADDNGSREGSGTQVGVSANVGVRVNEQNATNSEEGQSDSVQAEGNAEIEVERGDNNVRSTSSLEQSIKNREDELNSEAASSTDQNEQDALNDNNGMRLAVHTLLSSKDMLGGIGPQVSALAQQLNDSVTSTISAEVKIQSRGWLRKLFFGGDQTNSASLQGQVNQNLQTMQKLNDLIANCSSCSADLKTTLQTRLSLALSEQTKLQAIAQVAMQSKGIFGVLFGWAGR